MRPIPLNQSDPSSPLAYAYFTWHRAGKCEVKSSRTRACFWNIAARARTGREDDSKCHPVVWGQPSQTHSSCRRCCHPPPHCLCKWCLQSRSDTWRFHPSPVALLRCRRLPSYKLSPRPSSPAAPCIFFCGWGEKKVYLTGNEAVIDLLAETNILERKMRDSVMKW